MTRRTIAGLLAALLVALIAGCGKNAPAPSTAPATPSSGKTSSGTSGGSTSTPSNSSQSSSDITNLTGPAASAAAAKAPEKTYEKVSLGPLKQAEKANIGPITVSLDEVAVVKKATGLPQGYAYVVVKLSITNNESMKPYTINASDHFKITTPAGKDSRINIQATGQRTPRIQGSVDKGTTQSGWIGYMVKVGDGNYQYSFNHPEWGDVVWEFPI